MLATSLKYCWLPRGQKGGNLKTAEILAARQTCKSSSQFQCNAGGDIGLELATWSSFSGRRKQRSVPMMTMLKQITKKLTNIITFD